MRRAALIVIAFLLFGPSTRAEVPDFREGEARRGVAFLASNIGSDVPAEEVLTLVETCRLDLVVFDFAWVTAHFDRTDFAALEALAKELAARDVVVAAMYRPRALQPGDADVHYAVDETGKTKEHHLDLCYAHEDSVRWGMSFGRKTLKRCPSIRHVVLYNVVSPCRCEGCRDGGAAKHVDAFLAACRRDWEEVRPDVRIGHVGTGEKHAERLDFLLPFLSVRRTAPDRPVDVAGELARIAEIRKRGAPRPVVPLAKVRWGPGPESTTEDVAAVIRASDGAGTGFLLWYYWWIFRSEDGGYDAGALVAALGGDPAKMAPFFHPAKPPADPALDGAQWIYFDSMETATGPRLVVRDHRGKREVVPVADSVIMSYLAERVWAVLPSLSISLADTNRVLIRFREGHVAGARSARLTLTMHQSAVPVGGPFRLAVHRVTEEWDVRDTTWARAPAFERDPVLVADVDPEAGELELDVSEWAASRDVRHGLLLKVAEPVPEGAAPPPAASTGKGPWTQPEIRTGTPFSDRIPWAADLEDALARAKETGRPILATVVPVSWRHWVSGWRGAEEIWRGLDPPNTGDAYSMGSDPGLVKERAMMATLFTDPAIARLVTEHFVPVRIRPYTLTFDAEGSTRYEDPLPALGTSCPGLGGPSLVFADADGKLIHACRRMAVFYAPAVRETLLAVLGKAGVGDVAPLPDDRPPALRQAWELAGARRFEAALSRLERLRDGDSGRWEADYLRGWLLLRTGDGAGARAAFTRAARGDPDGPWGSRAAIRLEDRGMDLAEWETLAEIPVEPMAGTTEVGPGESTLEEVMESAVDYLLLHPSPDGGWPDPFVSLISGPGSQWDKSVPVTGLVVDALMGMRRRLPRRRAELGLAIERGIDFVGRFADDPPPHVWRLTYALHLQNAILGSDLPASVKAKAKARAKKLVIALAGIQEMGGWSYMPPPRIHSFNTAPVLLLLTEVNDRGVRSPETMRRRAADFLEGLRLEGRPGEFAYAESVRHRSPKASSCRSALCELALAPYREGDPTDRIRAAVEYFFRHEETVRGTSKVYESYFSPAAMHDAYHYYFGHYYVARALALLPEAEARRHAKRQIETILPQREMDGSFVDAQMQGKSYGTAMVLLTLLEDLRLLGR